MGAAGGQLNYLLATLSIADCYRRARHVSAERLRQSAGKANAVPRVFRAAVALAVECKSLNVTAKQSLLVLSASGKAVNYTVGRRVMLTALRTTNHLKHERNRGSPTFGAPTV